MNSITSGHEELGLSKVFGDTDVHQREQSYHVATTWQGAIWGRFSLKGLNPLEESAVQKLLTDRVSPRSLDSLFINTCLQLEQTTRRHLKLSIQCSSLVRMRKSMKCINQLGQ